MMETFFLILLYLFVILADFIPVIKEKNKKEIWVYSILLSVSFGVIMLDSLDISIPSIVGAIKIIFQHIIPIE